VTLLIAHRGASGYLPEHTLAAYALGILQGADFIEPDLVATRDGVLVARHENEIGGTTDVAAHPEFAARHRRLVIDGVETEGWFTEDFTLEELRTLRVRERIAQLRPGNARHDGQLGIPTFAEILEYLAGVNASRAVAGQPLVGVYPETKHPSHFARLGLALEAPLLAALARGLHGAPVFIQSFETGNLQWLHQHSAFPLVQLMEAEGGPVDRAGASYAQMATPAGLAEIARYAAVIGVEKTMVVAGGPLVPAAHAAGLAVHVWTLRAENAFLPAALQSGPDPAAHGDLAAEVRGYVAAGVDGAFSDHPDLVRAALSVATPR
jgi:glycerophosphoryl diester phosphodiesterase